MDMMNLMDGYDGVHAKLSIVALVGGKPLVAVPIPNMCLAREDDDRRVEDVAQKDPLIYVTFHHTTGRLLSPRTPRMC
jgi:hypothetical protein